MPPPRLRGYRAQLTPGTTLGIGFAYYDSAYLATRDTHPVRFTVSHVTDTGVSFTLDNAHRRDLLWDTVLTCFCLRARLESGFLLVG